MGLLALKHELDEQRRRIVAIEQGLIQAGQLPASTLLGAPISVIVTAGAGLWWVARPDARAGALLLVVISWGLTAILYLRARARIRDRINTAEKQRRQQLERFESGAASFLRSVHAFERAAVEPLTGLFSPTVGPHRALPGRDIRLRVETSSSTPTCFRRSSGFSSTRRRRRRTRRSSAS